MKMNGNQCCVLMHEDLVHGEGKRRICVQISQTQYYTPTKSEAYASNQEPKGK